MEKDLEYELSNGVRYVVAYMNGGFKSYFSPLYTTLADADKIARCIIKGNSNIANRLRVVKVKPVAPVTLTDALSEVMVWTKNPRFYGLETIHENPYKAKSFCAQLSEEFMISAFSEEVVKTYKDES